MGRLDAFIALVAGSTLAGFVGLVGFALLTAFGVLSAGSVSADDADGYGVGATGEAVSGSTYERLDATLDGETVAYLDFGDATPLTDDGTVAIAPIWVFIDGFDAEGRPRMSTERSTVVDVVPGDAGYSDLWDVQFVIVPSDYEGPDIRSLEELEASGLQVITPGMLVNCPLAPADATTSEGHELRQGWYRGEEIYYFDFGVTTPEPGDVYEFVQQSGSSSYGYGVATTTKLDVPPLVVLPEGEGPTAQFFRRHEVTVSNAAVAESIRSASHLAAGGVTTTFTGELVNRPLVTD